VRASRDDVKALAPCWPIVSLVTLLRWTTAVHVIEHWLVVANVLVLFRLRDMGMARCAIDRYVVMR